MNVLDYVNKHITFLDGGMGTLLQARGLQPGELPERWNLTHPRDIADIQKSYYDAGTNIVATNTFGANGLKYGREELTAIIHGAIDNARAAREESAADHEKFIALDVGPLGRLLEPYGDLPFERAVELYGQTIAIGAEYGVDLILIETMNDSLDTKAAVLAAKENSSLPVFVSNAYGEDGKLMTGADPAAMVAMLEGLGVDALGVNCSLGPKQLVPVVEAYLRCSSLPVLVKPNAGLPQSIDGKTVFMVGPEEFGEDVCGFLKAGARIAGGCCGTTPDHIRALAAAAAGLTPVPVTDKDRTVISSYTHAVEFGRGPVIIGERINPTGKKRFKEALRSNDIPYILGEGLSQQEKGAHVLDVNVGLPEIDEPAMMLTVTKELQAVSDLPLQIDTTDIRAMEAALRCYNGKAMVNSVNGKAESMAAVFPLVKKYGGLVVCLTLDEEGIPDSAERRVEIAKKIIRTAAEYGIPKKDLIFDTLAMTVSADNRAALSTLQALRTIRQELGCQTSLGISNISFGLPNREIITAVFFGLALENGLSAAIMNPGSGEVMKTYYAYNALHGLDDNCTAYIENIGRYAAAPAAAPAAGAAPAAAVTASGTAPAPAADPGDLQYAIVKGLKERAAVLCEELLKTEAPLEVVNSKIIPALDAVGQGFEQKTVYLPQLLMSAEAAQSAFEKIRARLQSSAEQAPARAKFVLATVKGDIHDIGKNIVKLIMENYGFNVIDLGKDVAPELVVEAALREEAPLVGLSALMTTTVPAMEETIKLLREKAPHVKVIVGGAVLTPEYAERIGADYYAKDAMASVRCALEVTEGK